MCVILIVCQNGKIVLSLGQSTIAFGEMVSFFGNTRFKFRRSAWLTLPVAILSIVSTFSGLARADIESGLSMTVYNNFGYNGNPPLPSISGRPVVGEMTVTRVEQNFDQSPPFGLYEDFIVQYEGFVTSPVSGSFRFWPTADDGTQLYIDDIRVQNDWRDKGGGGALSSYVDFEAGVSKKFEMWFYENGGGAWTTLYWDIGQGWEIVPDSAFTKQSVPTTTTTIAPYLNNPQNLVVTSTNESKVYLSWDAPEESNANVERYAIFWSCDNWSSGFAISSFTTSAVVENFEPEQSCQFKVRADNDSIPVYSGWSNEINGVTLPTTTTSTTTSTSTTTTTQPEPETTPTSIFVFPTLPPADTEEPVETPPSQSDTESDEPVTSVPQYAEEQEEPAEEAPVDSVAEAAVAEIDTTEVSAAELANVVSDILSNIESAEELGSIVSDILDKPLTDEQFSSVIDEVLSEPLSAEELSAVLDAVFDEPLSDEKFDSVIDAVLEQPLSDEQFEEVVSILESDNVTEEQVASAVDSIIENGVTEDQATELATSEKVLQSIDGEQATEIFEAVDISAVTAEEAAQLVEAVQNAPTEVREALESEINVFDGAIDTYVPLGSAVDVGTRRVVVAAAIAATTITMSTGGAPSAPSAPSGGGSGGGGGGGAPSENKKTSNRRKI
jgi:hypothetical protein